MPVLYTCKFFLFSLFPKYFILASTYNVCKVLGTKCNIEMI